jgi:hypothetical protein
MFKLGSNSKQSDLCILSAKKETEFAYLLGKQHAKDRPNQVLNALLWSEGRLSEFLPYPEYLSFDLLIYFFSSPVLRKS